MIRHIRRTINNNFVSHTVNPFARVLVLVLLASLVASTTTDDFAMVHREYFSGELTSSSYHRSFQGTSIRPTPLLWQTVKPNWALAHRRRYTDNFVVAATPHIHRLSLCHWQCYAVDAVGAHLLCQLDSHLSSSLWHTDTVDTIDCFFGQDILLCFFS